MKKEHLILPNLRIGLLASGDGIAFHQDLVSSLIKLNGNFVAGTCGNWDISGVDPYFGGAHAMKFKSGGLGGGGVYPSYGIGFAVLLRGKGFPEVAKVLHKIDHLIILTTASHRDENYDLLQRHHPKQSE